MKRYFLAFYSGTTESGNSATGYMDFDTVDNYLNYGRAIEQIKEASLPVKFRGLVLTNIIELSETDMKAFKD
jgi:hypothetical protein